jgi:hypothetical protein
MGVLAYQSFSNLKELLKKRVNALADLGVLFFGDLPESLKHSR